MDKDLVTWNDDLHHARGSLGQLQAAIIQLLKRTPNVEQFNDLIQIINRGNTANGNGGDGQDQFLIEKLKQILTTPQVKIGIKFKQLFELDELPFLKMLTLIQLKLNKETKDSDEFMNYLLEYHRNEESPKLEIDSDMKELREMDEKFDVTNSSDSIQLPDLLPIKDEKLFKRIFLHRSFMDPLTAMENLHDITNYDNSKLVIRGRLILEGLLLEVLLQKYPKMYHEDMIILVNQLLNENILFKLSLIYNLKDNFKFKFSNRISMIEKLRIIGEIFLSYIGGLSYEYSRVKLKIWIYKIYKWILPKVRQDLNLQGNNSELIENQFEFLMKDLSVILEFTQVEHDPYVMKLTISQPPEGANGGQSIGEYVGTNSKDKYTAKVNAIKQFLSNEALIPLLMDNYQYQTHKRELHERSQLFNELLKSKSIEVNYSQIQLDQVYHLTIKIDELILSSSFDRDETMVKLKGESMALDNLKVLTNGV